MTHFEAPFRRRSNATALAVGLALAGTFSSRTGAGEAPPPPVCLNPVVCTGAVAGCIKVATSLPAVGGTTVGMWESAGGFCGSKRKWRWCAFLRVPCGPPLAGAACP